ncbi:uncharacterized protein PgNI_02625 [Pyricularia grisea]|uniref:Carrier domain-containing protein n=1 Tax=Pyricularia grisea TaxID=148305 RepID=A0A6P8BHW4_PYRGI|nr:uncharacterized protein PgNI_02625 [Pyricularia grisea]TLD16232.1 hypothetical protein PgNI_02625 [Pyricularia grisea]
MPPQGGMPHPLNPKFPSLKQAKLEILSAVKKFKPQDNKPRRAIINNFNAAGGNIYLLMEGYKGLPALTDGVGKDLPMAAWVANYIKQIPYSVKRSINVLKSMPITALRNSWTLLRTHIWTFPPKRQYRPSWFCSPLKSPSHTFGSLKQDWSRAWSWATLWVNTRLFTLREFCHLPICFISLANEFSSWKSFAIQVLAATAETVQQLIDAKPDVLCSISCLNAPKLTVIGGLVNDIKQLETEISKFGPKQLPIPYAFHIFQMDLILKPLKNFAKGVTFSAPKFPVALTLLAKIQTRQQIQFVKTIQAVKEKLGGAIWLEVGPFQVYGLFVKAILNFPPNLGAIMSTLLYEQGAEIDWLRLYSPYREGLKLVNFPTYAWNLQKFWITYTERGRQSLNPLLVPGQTYISTCAQVIVEEISSRVVMRTSMTDPGMQAIIEGHRIRDVAICPGSAFCNAALTVAQRLFERNKRSKAKGKPVLTIRNLSLRSPFRKEPGPTLKDFVTTTMVSVQSSDDSQITFRYRNKILGSCKVLIFKGAGEEFARSRTNFFIKAKLDDFVAKSGIFYSLFTSTVQYSPNFKRLKKAYILKDFTEAAAEITLEFNPNGTRFTLSPYHGKSLVHLAGFLLNSNPSRSRSSETTFIMDNLESVQTINTAALVPGETYWTFARLSSRINNSATCNVWVFQQSQGSAKLVIFCFGLRFHEVNNVVFDRLLGKNKLPAQVSKDRQKYNKSSKREIINLAPAVPLYPPQVSGSIENHNTPAAAASVKLSSGLCAAIFKSIFRETGTDLSQLTDDTALADIGVNSIMAIKIIASVNKETNIYLNVITLINYPTINAFRAAFGHKNTALNSTDENCNMVTPTPELSELSDWVGATPANTASRSTTSLIFPLKQKAPPKIWATIVESQTPTPIDIKPTVLIKETLKRFSTPKARIVLLYGRPKDK